MFSFARVYAGNLIEPQELPQVQIYLLFGPTGSEIFIIFCPQESFDITYPETGFYWPRFGNLNS